MRWFHPQNGQDEVQSTSDSSFAKSKAESPGKRDDSGPREEAERLVTRRTPGVVRTTWKVENNKVQSGFVRPKVDGEWIGVLEDRS